MYRAKTLNTLMGLIIEQEGINEYSGQNFLLHKKRLLLAEMYSLGNFCCKLYAGGQSLP